MMVTETEVRLHGELEAMKADRDQQHDRADEVESKLELRESATSVLETRLRELAFRNPALLSSAALRPCLAQLFAADKLLWEALYGAHPAVVRAQTAQSTSLSPEVILGLAQKLAFTVRPPPKWDEQAGLLGAFSPPAPQPEQLHAGLIYQQAQGKQDVEEEKEGGMERTESGEQRHAIGTQDNAGPGTDLRSEQGGGRGKKAEEEGEDEGEGEGEEKKEGMEEPPSKRARRGRQLLDL